MRRIKKKEINIFSISALDLFASAMGAFVLIAIISMPYYLNIDQSDIVKKQKNQINALNSKIKDNLKGKKLLENKISKLREKNFSLSKQVEHLQKKLQRSIKFALLGIATNSDTFTILVDMSGSVLKYKNTIQDVLFRLLKQMKNRASIQIIGYYSLDGKIYLNKFNENNKIVFLNDNSYKQAIAFSKNIINNIKNNAKTPTYLALHKALFYKGKDIILISDGEPTDKTPIEIIDKIAHENNSNKKIHTIAIGNYIKNLSFSKFMMDLSSKNNGGFIGVASIDSN